MNSVRLGKEDQIMRMVIPFRLILSGAFLPVFSLPKLNLGNLRSLCLKVLFLSPVNH